MQKILWDLRKNEYRLTQQEVADFLGITVQAYRSKEKGVSQFTQDEMFALASLFHRDLDSIFLPRKHQNGNKLKQEA